jgi:hypothetical protein
VIHFRVIISRPSGTPVTVAIVPRTIMQLRQTCCLYKVLAANLFPLIADMYSVFTATFIWWRYLEWQRPISRLLLDRYRKFGLLTAPPPYTPVFAYSARFRSLQNHPQLRLVLGRPRNPVRCGLHFINNSRYIKNKSVAVAGR